MTVYAHKEINMKLGREEQTQLNNRFPKDVELSLGNHLSGKVQADLYEIIPVGKPAFLWITYFQNKNAALLVFKTQHGYKFEITTSCFIDELAYGTIFTGVYFTRPKTKDSFQSFFCINDIQYYRGKNVSEMTEMNMYNKLAFISQVFDNKELDNINGFDHILNISMPIFVNEYSIAQSYLGILPYPTYGIRFIDVKDKTAKGIQPGSVKSNTDEKCVFVVRANIEPDSYTLYAKGYKPNYEKHKSDYDINDNNGNKKSEENIHQDIDNKYGLVFSNKYGYLKKFGFGLVPTYQDSIRLNMLFRNIKENISIDAIEESDDEDEFENIEPTKFMIPNAEYKMYCYFSTNLNKWIPENIAPENTDISPLPKMNTFNQRNTHNNIHTKRVNNSSKTKQYTRNTQHQMSGNVFESVGPASHISSYKHNNRKYNQNYQNSQTQRHLTHLPQYQPQTSTYKKLKVDVNVDGFENKNNNSDGFINTSKIPRHNRNFNNKRLFSSPFQPFNKTQETHKPCFSPVNYRNFSSPSPTKTSF